MKEEYFLGKYTNIYINNELVGAFYLLGDSIELSDGTLIILDDTDYSEVVDSVCDNNFECVSNLYIDNGCVEAGFLRRL